jgi:hypothetical protein
MILSVTQHDQNPLQFSTASRQLQKQILQFVLSNEENNTEVWHKYTHNIFYCNADEGNEWHYNDTDCNKMLQLPINQIKYKIVVKEMT